MVRRSTITGKPIGKKIIKPQNARKIIRKYHVLLKQKAQLDKSGEDTSELTEELQKSQHWYQQASLSGQSSTRGGDSSRLLVEWLNKMHEKEIIGDLRVLEVGSLALDNAISKVVKHIERIDLNPQDGKIKKQDFMERPDAKNDSEKFDLISLSLVLNYVAEPDTRGEMLRKIRTYLTGPIPSLFLVLPTPCVDNSRYLTRDHFANIMKALGYELLEEKRTDKVSYWYYKWNGQMSSKVFKKRLINDGKGRNNFTVVL